MMKFVLKYLFSYRSFCRHEGGREGGWVGGGLLSSLDFIYLYFFCWLFYGRVIVNFLELIGESKREERP